MSEPRMNRRSLRFFWTDVSKEDINITKFLNLLLKYNYKWFPNDQPELNLKETDKERFIQECSESIDPVDEVNAYIIIEIIKDLFDEELSRLEECPRKDSESEIPWFSLACQLFPQSSIPEDLSIASPSTSSVAVASNVPPPSVSNLKMADASTSATASSSSMPNVQPFSWTTLLPTYEQPPFYQEKHLANPPSISPKNVYNNKFFPKNVMTQYDFPILYPVCIIPEFSLGRLRGSGFSCNPNENVSLFDKGIPLDLSSSFRPHISDFSYLPGTDGISDRKNSHRPDNRHSDQTNSYSSNNRYSDRANSYRPDNRHSSRTNSYHPYNYHSDRTNSNLPDNRHNQRIKPGKNSSQSDTSMNSIKPTAAGFTANHSLIKECGNFTKKNFSHESFRSSTAGTTSTVSRDIPSTSSFSTISRPTLTNIGHSSFHEASTPLSSRVSISQAYRDFTTPSPINSLPKPTLTNIGHSSFRQASTPLSSNVSTSQTDRDSTLPGSVNSLPRPMLTNIGHSSFSQASTPLSSSVFISQAYRDFTTPSPINSLPKPTLTNIGHSSFCQASTPLSSNVSTSQADRDSTLPGSANSLPQTVNWPHQLTVGSSLPSSTTVTSKGEPSYLNTNTAPVT